MNKFWKDLRKSVRTYKKQLENIETRKKMLESMRRYMTEEEYERELEKLEMESSNVYSSLNSANELLSTPKITEKYFDTIEKLVELYNETEDVDYKKVISEEINQRRNEVIHLNEQLPEELQEDFDNMYASVQLVNDSKLTEISKNREIYENLIREYNKEKADFIHKIGETYKSDSKENQKLREEYNTELKTINKLLKTFEKHLSRMNQDYEERAKIVKEATVAKVNPASYDKILNHTKNREQLESFCRKYGLIGIADEMRKSSELSKEKKESYKKKINSYLRKKKKAVTPVQQEQPIIATPMKEEEKATAPMVKKEEKKDSKEEKKEEKTTDDSKKKLEEKIKNLSNDQINTILENPTENYGYKTIIQKLVKDIKPKKYDGVGYEISKLKVKENFKEEIHTGNYLYSIAHVVPAIIKLPFIGVQKLVNRFLYRKSSEERMNLIKERLDKLPEKDLEILLKEYKNHVEIEKYGSGLNILINEKLEEYTNKKVEKLNKKIAANYKDLFDTMSKVQIADLRARDQSLSDDERYQYILIKNKLLEGRAQQVKSIRDDYNTAKSMLSDGMNGFTTTAKATALKNNYVGYFFAREGKLDTDLLDREASLERAEMNAIANNNDEMALRIFVEHEKLLCKNTKIKNSIFGKRSVGKKYYQPLAEKLEGARIPFAKKKKVTYGNEAIDIVEDYTAKEKVHTL